MKWLKVLLGVSLIGCPGKETSTQPDTSSTVSGLELLVDFNANCSKAPGWRNFNRCTHGESVYAVGQAKAIQGDMALSITTASNRAERAVVGGAVGRDKLSGIEVINTFVCEGVFYAFARTKNGLVSKQGLPKCDETRINEQAQTKCSGWMNKVRWIDGENVFGVGAVSGDVVFKSPRNARKKAAELARATLAKLRSIEVDSQSTPPSTYVVKGKARSSAQCDNTMFVLVTEKTEHFLPSPED